MYLAFVLGLLGGSVVKNPPTNAGDVGSIPGSGRFREEENGNPFQCSCLGNPMDRGTWQAAVLVVAKQSDTTKEQQQFITEPQISGCCDSKFSVPLPSWYRRAMGGEHNSFPFRYSFLFLTCHFQIYLLLLYTQRIRLQCGRPGFSPWVGKIPWRRAWQPTPVFLRGESHG